MKNFSTKSAIERLTFTILKQNKPNQNDADALTILANKIAEFETKNIQNNIVFAKLLLLNLQSEYRKKNDIDNSIFYLSEILKPNLNQMVQIFANEMHTTQLYNFIKTLKIDADNDLMDTDLDYIKFIENQFWNDHQKSIIDEIKSINSKNEFQKNFYCTANEILNNDLFNDRCTNAL